MNEEMLNEMLDEEENTGKCCNCVYDDLISVCTENCEDGALNINEFDNGTDDASYYIGFYSACVNSGMDIDTTLTMLQMSQQDKMFRYQCEHEKEVISISNAKLEMTQI